MRKQAAKASDLANQHVKESAPADKPALSKVADDELAGSAASTTVPPNLPAYDAVLGQVVGLMMSLPAYRYVFVGDLEWMVLPAILLGQFRLFKRDGQTAAFAAWAYLSEDAEQRLQLPHARLAPADWKSGDRLWIVSVYSPVISSEIIVQELRASVLKNKSFKYHRRTADGVSIVELVATNE